MLLPITIYQKFNDFLKPKINFSIKFNEYFYNDKWILDANQEYFNTAVYNIISDINTHLIQGKNNKKFLEEILQIAMLKYQWFNDYDLYDLNTIERINPKIQNVDYNLPNYQIPVSFSISDLENQTERFLEYENKNPEFISYMEFFRERTNNYENPLDFEKMKVLFTVGLLRKSLNKINSYVDSLKLDLEYLDFANLDFEEIMYEYEIIDFNTNDNSHQKCFTNLSKTDVANLFYFLANENIIFINKDIRKNEIAVKKFVEQNFTYKDESGRNMTINRINKEFGRVSLPENMERLQIPFLDDMINRLTAQKQKVEKQAERYRKS